MTAARYLVVDRTATPVAEVTDPADARKHLTALGPGSFYLRDGKVLVIHAGTPRGARARIERESQIGVFAELAMPAAMPGQSAEAAPAPEPAPEPTPAPTRRPRRRSPPAATARPSCAWPDGCPRDVPGFYSRLPEKYRELCRHHRSVMGSRRRKALARAAVPPKPEVIARVASSDVFAKTLVELIDARIDVALKRVLERIARGEP